MRLPSQAVYASHARQPLVPELDVTNLGESLDFYVVLIGFQMAYERSAERFAYLTLEGAGLMLQEATGPGRRFRIAPLERPLGRGVNFQIEVTDVDAIYQRLRAADYQLVVDMEERWYDVRGAQASGTEAAPDPMAAGKRQFAVGAPGGYLWRLFRDLGVPPLPGEGA